MRFEIQIAELLTKCRWETGLLKLCGGWVAHFSYTVQMKRGVPIRDKGKVSNFCATCKKGDTCRRFQEMETITFKLARLQSCDVGKISFFLKIYLIGH